MSMFCYQCQETVKNVGCVKHGVCGKREETANLQDQLIQSLKEMAVYARQAGSSSALPSVGKLMMEGLFVTVTNVNFDDEAISGWIQKVQSATVALKSTHLNTTDSRSVVPDIPCGILSTPNEDVRSLRELLIYGLKGIAAYAHHASVLGKRNPVIEDFLLDAMASTTQELTVDEMVSRVLKAGEVSVTTMALLDEANTEAYGNPVMTEVNLGVRQKPGILISGHDLQDLQWLLEQTDETGIDIYTHGEMLPGHYYPAFQKYEHFAGNYGGAWYDQKSDFAAFNGPILMTTNCIVPPSADVLPRFFTTGMAGYPGATHIPETEGKSKDFSRIIAMARDCAPPTELETGTIVGGFAHQQVLALADQVVSAVKSGSISRFVVMAGCDGRQSSRSYYTEVADQLPETTVILTAGCAKFRYNKLKLGSIEGIPRVLDAGQCNDSYSLVVVALKLKEVLGLADINDLPIEYDIAWYEQKAVAVLLALLHLGVRGIRLGPTLPAFLSPNVAKVLIDRFHLRPVGTAREDVLEMAGAVRCV